MKAMEPLQRNLVQVVQSAGGRAEKGGRLLLGTGGRQGLTQSRSEPPPAASAADRWVQKDDHRGSVSKYGGEGREARRH